MSEMIGNICGCSCTGYVFLQMERRA